MGGGLACRNGSSPTLSDCVFEGCTSELGGGLGCAESSAPHLSGCVFLRNPANEGGAVACFQSSSPTLVGCVFDRNTADVGAGLYANNLSSPTLLDCTFTGNTAYQLGGGMTCRESSSPVVTNCTFVRNASVMGGGVYCVNASVTITTSILAFGANGGAAACGGWGGLTLECCDVYGNIGGDWTDCLADQDGLNGNVSEDPLFCDLEDGNLAIDAVSPCAEDNNPACGLIGAHGIGCDTPAETRSWGTMKALFR
jgi:hypothetical protein